jgi:hypothetical protein
MKTSYAQCASAFVLGAASGATAAYFLDPDRGGYRRAVVRDGLLSEGRRWSRWTRMAWRDLNHRLRAVPHAFSARFGHTESPDELQLIERVRAKMGRYVSHPGSIQVGALQNTITLSGPILEPEHEALLHAVHSVPDVDAVIDHLVIYDSTDGIPALQGVSPRPGERWELLEEDWSPGVRLAVGAASGLLTLFGVRVGGVAGGVAAVAGTTLLARSIINSPLHRMPVAIQEQLAPQHKNALDPNVQAH